MQPTYISGLAGATCIADDGQIVVGVFLHGVRSRKTAAIRSMPILHRPTSWPQTKVQSSDEKKPAPSLSGRGGLRRAARGISSASGGNETHSFLRSAHEVGSLSKQFTDCERAKLSLAQKGSHAAIAGKAGDTIDIGAHFRFSVNFVRYSPDSGHSSGQTRLPLLTHRRNWCARLSLRVRPICSGLDDATQGTPQDDFDGKCETEKTDDPCQ